MDYSKKYDVVVVGSGVGGPIAARNIVRNGYSVLLVDKKYEIGAPKQCAEGIDLDVLEKNNVPLDKRFINREIKGASIHSPSNYKFEVKLGENKGLILERKVFDKFLAHQAAGAGADVMPGAEVRGLIRENERPSGVKIEFYGKTIAVKSEIIIAADGVGSSVARWAGIDTSLSPHDVDSAYEYEMVIKDFDFAPDMFYLYFGNDIAPRGYAWIFPKDQDRANVGIGVAGDSPNPPKYYLDRWLEKMSIKANKILEINSGLVPVGMPLKELVRENVAVVGDAARQLFLGGGMAESMSAATIASKWAVRALREKDVSLLKNYAKEWWETRGKKIEASVKITNKLEKLTDKEMDIIVEVMSKIDSQKFRTNDHKGIMMSLLKNPKIILNPKIVKMLIEMKPFAEAFN